MYDRVFVFLLGNTKPNNLFDSKRVVYKKDSSSWKYVAVYHEMTTILKNLVDVVDFVFIQTLLNIISYEMFFSSRLIGYLSGRIPF